jgi:hypothetical protein
MTKGWEGWPGLDKEPENLLEIDEKRDDEALRLIWSTSPLCGCAEREVAGDWRYITWLLNKGAEMCLARILEGIIDYPPPLPEMSPTAMAIRDVLEGRTYPELQADRETPLSVDDDIRQDEGGVCGP